MRVTLMVISTSPAACLWASQQPCVAVKTDVRFSTVPQTTRNSQSRSFPLLAHITAARRTDLSITVDGSALPETRKFSVTTSSCQTTFPFLQPRITLIFHHCRPGRQRLVLQSSRQETRVWVFWPAHPCTTSVENTSTWSPSSHHVYSTSRYPYTTAFHHHHEWNGKSQNLHPLSQTMNQFWCGFKYVHDTGHFANMFSF